MKTVFTALKGFEVMRMFKKWQMPKIWKGRLLVKRDEDEEALILNGKEVVENQAKLSLALDVSQMAPWEGFFHGDDEHYFIFNDQFYSLYGTNAQEENGYKMTAQAYAKKFMHPDDMWMMGHELRRIAERSTNRNISDLEHRIIRLDGEVRHIAVRYKVLRNNDGEPIKTIGANQDITDQKQIEEKLEKARQQAESANRAKSSFLANMSHEIRTPMNGLLGILQLLQQTGLTGEQKKLIETAIHSTKHLNRLLSDILDLSRVEAEKMNIRTETFSVKDSLITVTQLHEPTAQAKRIELKRTIDSNLPISLMGDALRLQQVLGNLVGNAIKFTQFGSVEVEAHLLPSYREDEIRVLFTVSDSGIGIPDQALRTLFNPFVQAEHPTKKNYEGAGLGLAISKHLISLMGGNIAIVSNEGAGTKIFLCLPFKKIDTLSPVIIAENRLRVPTGLKVLLAEDDKVSSMVATKFLEDLQYDVSAVENGEQVLAQLREEIFDLVVMDIQMPILDGAETARAIRLGEAGQRCKSIPILAMTACAMVGDKEKFQKVGMSGYVKKPVEVEALQSELTRIFENVSRYGTDSCNITHQRKLNVAYSLNNQKDKGSGKKQID